MKTKKLHTDQLEEICKKFGVKKLYVFGSVAKGIVTDANDIDFLVEFEETGFEGAFDRFMGLKNSLESMYGKPVDLLTMKKFRNPVFHQEVDTSKSLIYAA